MQGAVALPQMLAGSDLTLARDVLGFTPTYRMREAVADLTQWIRSRAAR